MKPLYRTKNGVLYLGDANDILETPWLKRLRNKVSLIFTSPPFPLNQKKAYGNLKGQEYIDWLVGFTNIFKELLTERGSLVIELGNAWVSGSPTMSLLPIESLIALKNKGDFHLCQEFIYHNTTRLPSPAQWVNVERIRVKDAFTRLWWLSPSENPNANNRRVLQEYSQSMKNLLKNQKYNSGKRPSEHNIGEKSFLTDNGGAIPSNVISLPNSVSNDPYLRYCRANNLKFHPARMPLCLAEFFIKFLTEPDDLVLDPFAGSNVTGYVAETLGRRWRSVEKEENYATSSKSRFSNAWFIKPYKKG